MLSFNFTMGDCRIMPVVLRKFGTNYPRIVYGAFAYGVWLMIEGKLNGIPANALYALEDMGSAYD